MSRMATGNPGLILTTWNDLTCSQVKVQYDQLLKRTSLFAPVSKVPAACAKGSTQERNRFHQQVMYCESAGRTFSIRKKLPALYTSVPFNSEQHCTWELLPPTFTWKLLTRLVNKHATLACLAKECFRKKHWSLQEKLYRWSFSCEPVLLMYSCSKTCTSELYFRWKTMKFWNFVRTAA